MSDIGRIVGVCSGCYMAAGGIEPEGWENRDAPLTHLVYPRGASNLPSVDAVDNAQAHFSKSYCPGCGDVFGGDRYDIIIYREEWDTTEE